MMGHVLTMLCGFVREVGGEDGLARVLANAGCEPQAYRFEQAYPEDHFAAVLRSAVSTLGVAPDDAERAFAAYFMRVSPDIFPAIFQLSGDARTLLGRVPHLHRSIPSGASRAAFRDKLTVEEDAPGRLVMRYDSPHRLCTFLKRAAELVLEHYGETGTVRELCCAREGSDACRVEVLFDREGPPGRGP